MFDPSDPSRFRTLRDRNLPRGQDFVATLMLVSGAIIDFVGSCGLIASTRLRRRLAESVWEPVERLPDIPMDKAVLTHLRSASGRDVYLSQGRGASRRLSDGDGDGVWVLARDSGTMFALVRMAEQGEVRVAFLSAVSAQVLARRSRD